jgi:hypothetical protein
MLRAVLMLCVVLSAGLVSGPADARMRDRDREGDAQQSRERERRDDDWKRNRPDSAADAARLATMRNGGGRVLSVEPLGGGSHRVKVIKDGVVRIYVVDDR